LIDLWEAMSRAEIRHAHLIEQLAGRREGVVPAVSRAVLITTALEFSEMDDLFTAICQSAGVAPDDGRTDHLTPLVQAVLAREEGDRVLRHLLAAMLRLRRRAGSAPSALDADSLALRDREMRR
jgi:hypothetical protein